MVAFNGKAILKIILSIMVFLFLLIWWYSINDRAVDYKVSMVNTVIPKFTEQTIDYQPVYDAENTIPFTASAIIDIDNDGVEELFVGGGINQQDAFFQFRDGQFENITDTTGWEKQTPDNTLGSIALDLDADGDTDMLVTRQSGVWLYRNDAGHFSANKLNLDLDSETVPLSVAVADLNRDGLFDMYISGYIGRKYVEGETIFNQEYGGVSALFLNQGGGKFTNITKQAGLYYKHNTFQAIFIDIDGDNLEDLVVAHDTGQVKTWKRLDTGNLNEIRYASRPNPTSEYFSYPMGIAVGDYNNNGRPDFFFSNVGSTTPSMIVRGDLRDEQVLNQKWLMFDNQGDFKFDDVAQSTRLADYEFSWGAIFEDFNLDGRDDLVVAENYISFPTHVLPLFRLNGRFMLQNERGEFAAAGELAGVQNRLFGISPLTADFNQDGYPDLVHINLEGPQKVFLSKAGEHNYLKIKLPNTVSSIGAKLTVTLDTGKAIHQTFVVGEGLCSDQSHIQNFGLTKSHAISVLVRYLDGTVDRRTGKFSNQLIDFTH